MRKIIILLVIVLVAFVSGCTAKSKEDLISEVAQIAKSTFQKAKTDANVELNNFSVYLPNKFEIKEEGTSNLVLQKGEQLYILFLNPLEDSSSRLNYDTATKNKGYSLLKSFEEKDKFGFVMVLPRKEDEFEIQTGVGGVKLSTVTNLANIREDAEIMMEIANSLLYHPDNE